MNAITRRIATALAGPAIATGFLAGAIALGAPANAEPQGTLCYTAKVTAESPDVTSLLTRPGQLDAANAAQSAVSAISCIGH